MTLRKRISSFLLAAVLLLAMLPLTASAKDFPEVLAQAKKGVVQLYGRGSDGRYWSSWTGTGFAVGETGQDSDIFLTNWHVVTSSGDYDLSQVRIWILKENCQISDSNGEPDPNNSIECEVLKTTTGYPDYAIIRAKTPVSGYEAMPLLSSNDVPDGTTVYALGYPAVVGNVSVSQYGIDDITSTNGIISQHMQFTLAENTWVLTHTAQISGGNSGGPLITEDGAVVGLNTYGFGNQDTGMNRYCAVYIDYAMDGLDELGIEYGLYGEEAEGSETGSEEDGEEKGFWDRIGDLLKGDEDSDSEGSPVPLLAVGAAVVVIAVVAVLLVMKKKKEEEARRREAEARRQEQERQQELQRQEEARRREALLQQQAQNERVHLRSFDGRVIPVGNGATIGRDPGCTIVLPENTPGVSRMHCRLEMRGGQLILTDLNSTYGTLIHGRRIPANTPVALKIGSSFSLASEKYTFTVC
ncbi:MAG: trypsin-like peptidase domain-containing protein [Faecousia sp.]